MKRFFRRDEIRKAVLKHGQNLTDCLQTFSVGLLSPPLRPGVHIFIDSYKVQLERLNRLLPRSRPDPSSIGSLLGPPGAPRSDVPDAIRNGGNVGVDDDKAGPSTSVSRFTSIVRHK